MFVTSFESDCIAPLHQLIHKEIGLPAVVNRSNEIAEKHDVIGADGSTQ